MKNYEVKSYFDLRYQINLYFQGIHIFLFIFYTHFL